MITLHDVDLSTYTTIHIGGIAETMLIPETTDELLNVVKNYAPKYFISGGSNLLISNRTFDLVVNLRSFDSSIQDMGDGKVLVGASVRLQRLINEINYSGLGGIEFLYSVPGLVGGAVAMNAGRGRKHNVSISDYVEYVNAIYDGVVQRFSKRECDFTYRNSCFKHSNMIITSVLFKFPEMSIEKSSREKEARISTCRKSQDTSLPNFGSVFSVSNPIVMNLSRKMKIGTGAVHFSSVTTNWLVNEGKGSFDEAFKTIKMVELLHKITLQRSEREVIVWE